MRKSRLISIPLMPSDKETVLLESSKTEQSDLDDELRSELILWGDENCWLRFIEAIIYLNPRRGRFILAVFENDDCRREFIFPEKGFNWRLNFAGILQS